MKKFIATVSTAALITAALAGPVSAADKAFTDINGSYAKDAIIELQSMGILSGIDATHFDPKGTLTRAQFVTIIIRALGIDANATASQYSDVKGWAIPYVEAAANAGIIQGVGNGMFSPNATLTREEAATILVRALNLSGELGEADTLTFTDAAQISEWARPYIALAVKYGLVQGNPDGTFNPKGSANREMAATMGVNLLGALDDVKPVTPPVVTPPVVTPPVVTPPVVTPPSGGGVYYPPYTPPVVTPPTEEADTTIPVITLNGSTVTEVVYGTAYTDAGATAEDNKDGDLSGGIVITISNEAGDTIEAIDTTVPGTYTYHYNVSDAAGNAAVEVTRSVVVSEEVVNPPVEADLTTYNDALNAVNEVDYTTESWAAYQAIVKANVVTTASTQVQVDAATAAITAAQSALVLKPVVEEPLAPVISNVSIASSNANPAYAKVGDTVTLTFSTDEEVSKLSNFKINGSNPTTFTSEASDDTWLNTATYIVEESDAEGIMNFQINVKNGAGIFSITTEATNDGSSVTVSKAVEIGMVTIDTVDQPYSDFAKTGDTVMLTFTTNEHVSKLNNFKINGSNPTTFDSRPEMGMDGVWTNTVTYVIEDSDPEGLVTFQINVQNDAGIYSVTTEETTNGSSVTVYKSEEYVQPQDFGYWVDATPDSAAYNVGFDINLDNLPYSKISKIDVSLVDGSGNVLATRTATGDQITQLIADDATSGGLDGQLSAAFIYRDADATNEWWNSTAYDFTTPAKAVISITDNTGKVYVVENGNPTGGSSGEVSNPQDYLATQDFGYWNDQFAYNLGFKIDVEKLPYANMKSIEVALVDADGNVLTKRTATGTQIEALAADDETYAPIDGQLSAAFVYRDADGMNEWWNSTAYDMTTPSKAVITITDKSNRIIKVESGNPSTTSPVYVEMQDFAALPDDGYNLGFKLNLDALGGYDNIASITGTVTDSVYGEVSRIAIDTPQRLMNYMADDSADGLDGQLSFDFRTLAYVTEEYGGTETSYTNYIKPIANDYDGTPTSTQIVIVTNSGATIVVNR